MCGCAPHLRSSCLANPSAVCCAAWLFGAGIPPPPFFANRSSVVLEDSLIDDDTNVALSSVAPVSFFSPRDQRLLFDPRLPIAKGNLSKMVNNAKERFIGAALCDAQADPAVAVTALTNATHGAIQNALRHAARDFMFVVPHFRYHRVSPTAVSLVEPEGPGDRPAEDPLLQGRLEMLLPLVFDSSPPRLALSLHLVTTDGVQEYHPTAILTVEVRGGCAVVTSPLLVGNDFLAWRCIVVRLRFPS